MSPNPSSSTSPGDERQGASAVPFEDDAAELAADDQAELAATGEVVVAEVVESPADKKNKLPEIPIAEVAVITSQADLDKVLAKHKGWMEAVLDPKVEVAHGRANLRGADLRPYDLSGVNLSGADLSGANLQGVELVNANLTVANLTNANLACANLRGARMMRVKIDGTDLRGADMTGAQLVGVDLSKAQLKSKEEPAPALEVAPHPEGLVTEPEASQG